MDQVKNSDSQQPPITEKPVHEEQDENVPKEQDVAQTVQVEDDKVDEQEGIQVKHEYENNQDEQNQNQAQVQEEDNYGEEAHDQ